MKNFTRIIIFGILILVTVSFCYPNFSNNDDLEWIRKIVDKLKVTEYYITIDQDDNLLITGYFINKVDFGNRNFLVAMGNYDIFVAKFNHDGNLLWVVQIGSDKLDIAKKIRTDDLGNVFVTGYISGISIIEDYIIKPKGSYDIFTAKYSANGKLQWIKCEGAEIICESNASKRNKIVNNLKGSYSYKN